MAHIRKRCLDAGFIWASTDKLLPRRLREETKMTISQKTSRLNTGALKGLLFCGLFSRLQAFAPPVQFWLSPAVVSSSEQHSVGQSFPSTSGGNRTLVRRSL